MEVNKNVRCVHRKTGEVVFNHAVYANDPSWQKSTGYFPQPEPQAEAPKAEHSKPSNDLTKETKQDTNVKTTETTTNGGRGPGSGGSSNAGRN